MIVGYLVTCDGILLNRPSVGLKQELSTEEWRDVIGYESIYSISSLGRLRTGPGCRLRAGRFLKPQFDRDGYIRYALSKSGKVKKHFAHHLVAAAFLGIRPDGLVTNHKDGIKQNNHPSNLEYITVKENTQHAYRHGLMAIGDKHWSRLHPEKLARGDNHAARKHPEYLKRGAEHHARLRPECMARGERQGSSKLTQDDVLSIKALSAQGISQRALAKQFNVSRRAITFIQHGINWKHVK